jgi:hypothetical protein
MTNVDNKVIAGGVAGAATIIILYIARLAGLDDIPAEVGGALTTLLGFVAGYFKKSA